ncbi:MAG: phosphoribosylglycinamide formyltransferase [Myxococcales bacterium]|nr:phosphoribosylglycinamide formyltransferase [Myxococcales bacterium]
MTKLRIGVLVSGTGSNLQALIDASRGGRLDADIAVVISNKAGVRALERAREADIPSVVVSHKEFKSRERFEVALIKALRDHDVRCVVLAGFMRLLTGYFLDAFSGRVINIHPSLLPAFPGVDAQRQAFEHGVKIAGCTVHFVDRGTDTGPIIAQRALQVRDDDTAETLRARILELEHQLLPEALQLLAEDRLRVEGRRVLIADEGRRAVDHAALDKAERGA